MFAKTNNMEFEISHLHTIDFATIDNYISDE